MTEITGITPLAADQERTYAGLSRTGNIFLPPLVISGPRAAPWMEGSTVGVFSEELRRAMVNIEHDFRASCWEQVWGTTAPDRNPMPRFIPFPAVDKIEQRWKQARRQVREARSRIEQAADILRYGYTEEDEW